MSEMKRTITRNIKTTVHFSNKDVLQVLLKAAGAPDGVESADLCEPDGDTIYIDFEVTWWTTEAVEDQ